MQRMASQFPDDDLDLEYEPAAPGPEKRRKKNPPAANGLTDPLKFTNRLVMDKGRLAFVRAHMGGKAGSGARVEAFRALLAQPRALAHFVAVVESLLLSFPSAQKGEAPATCDLFCAISCACLLLHNFSTKKSACPAREVAPALARLLA